MGRSRRSSCVWDRSCRSSLPSDSNVDQSPPLRHCIMIMFGLIMGCCVDWLQSVGLAWWHLGSVCDECFAGGTSTTVTCDLHETETTSASASVWVWTVSGPGPWSEQTTCYFISLKLEVLIVEWTELKPIGHFHFKVSGIICCHIIFVTSAQWILGEFDLQRILHLLDNKDTGEGAFEYEMEEWRRCDVISL